jgi:hypothetical protein
MFGGGGHDLQQLLLATAIFAGAALACLIGAGSVRCGRGEIS